jgi:dipeptidyl aminopeptidase/acylaminoacyl peptidase
MNVVSALRRTLTVRLKPDTTCFRRITIATLVAGVAALAPLGAQAPRPISIVELAELPRIFSPALSPDGRTLVYMLSRSDWKSGRLIWHLWRQEIGGGAPVQLTFTETGDIPVGLRWSPDGKTLLFLRAGQISLLPAGGGESRVLSGHATGVSSPSWTPDGRAIYFLASDPPTAEERERTRLRDDVYAFDEDYRQRHLWKIAVATGEETQVTKGNFSVLEYKLSPDGTRIAVKQAPSPLEEDGVRSEIWFMDASGGNARALTSNTIEENSLDVSPDNAQVLFVSEAGPRLEPYYPFSLFVVPTSGGATRAVLPDYRYTVEQAVWSPRGRAILATVNMGVHTELFEIEPESGRTRQLTDGQHYIAPGWSAVGSAAKIVFQVDEPARFGDVWTLAIADGPATPQRITGHFDNVERSGAMPRQEKVEWKSADGTAIEGLLFYPFDYRPGQRYPLVVQLHSGPMVSDNFGAGPGLVLQYFPVLTGKGYAVLRPNYRGSSGYGSAFYRDVNNGYFNHMTSDVMSGIDHLVQAGIADPDRLIAMGWSAGGTLVNKLVTMTDRFKAASAGAGIANWISLFGQTDNTSFRRTWFGGTPWHKNARVEAFWNSSPLKDVANVKTPLLLFAGENDPRVPMAQSIEMFRALRSHNVPTHLHIAPREGHVWSDLRHLLFKANTEIEWFEKYANGRTYISEKAPQP